MKEITSNLIVKDTIFDEWREYKNCTFYNFISENSNICHPTFIQCKFEKSIFKNSDLSNSGFFDGCNLEDCTFEKCDLRNIGIGNDGVVFKNCTFKKSDMRGMSMTNAKFIDCDFIGSNIMGYSLNVSNIVGCNFSGVLREIKFSGKENGREKLIACFYDCKFDFVEFYSCDLSECQPPKLKNHIYVTNLKEKIKNARLKMNLIADISSGMQKILFRRMHSLASMDQYIFNVKNIQEIEGSEFTSIFFKLLDVNT